MESTNIDDGTEEDVGIMLKRAYVLMSHGYFEKALATCEQAAEEPAMSLAARALQGAILTASGRPKEAVKLLMPLHRRNRDALGVALYLAEACYFAGRHRRAQKILDSLDEEKLENSPWSDFAHALRDAWKGLGELEKVPEPTTVALGDER